VAINSAYELRGAGIICLEPDANGPADVTATPSSLASLKSGMVLPF